MPPPPSPLQHAHDLVANGRLDEARAIVTGLLQRTPSDHQANCLMCYLLTKRGEHQQALTHITRALHTLPNDPNYLANLGKLQLLTGQRDAGLATLRRVLELNPANLNARIDLAGALEESRQYAAAAEECRAGLSFHPEHPALSTTLAVALLSTGQIAAALARLRRAAAANPDDLTVASTLAGALLYEPTTDPAELLAAHRRFGAILTRRSPHILPPPPNPRDPERRLRIGLLSPDFRGHSVAYFVEPILAALNRARFHITAYMTSAAADATTARLRPMADAWRDAAFLSEPELAARIRADQIDILIDLAGHMRGQRLAALHLRPAPVQVTCIGYPATTGVPAIDARLVDSITDPPGPADAHTTESLIRLDPVFLCYRPPSEPPDAAPPPSSSTGRITFGSFNALQKLNDPLLDLWADLLRQLPDSRLILKAAALGEPAVSHAFADRFAARGIDPSRLELLGWASSLTDHLSAYHRIDIALDTFPYCGTTTTCEALLMGVPVVTLRGSTHAARVGATLLAAAGEPRLNELVASSPAEYLAAALALARDPARLASLRRSLRPALLASTLCDQRGYADRLQSALRSLWQRYCTAPPTAPAHSPPPAAPTPPTPHTPLTPPSPAAAPALQDALAHLNAGHTDQARSLLIRAVRRWPNDPAVADSLASLLLQQGEPAQAAFYAEQALRTWPDDPGLLLTFGHALALSRQGERAIPILERAIQRAPDWPEPRAALAALCMSSLQFARAVAVCEPLAASPASTTPDLAAHYASALLSTARVEEAAQVLDAAADRWPGDLKIAESRAFTINYLPGVSTQRTFEAHIAYGAGLHRQMAQDVLPPLSPANRAFDPERPLRIGILSPDLRAHAVASFVEPILRHLDTRQFEVTAYFTNTFEDRVSQRLRSMVHRWRHEVGPDQHRLARQIRADGIDILLELSGLTALHRLPVLALRPAPVQISYIGYPNTTGLASIDYRIVDSLTDPPAPVPADDFAAERLLRLDPCFLCYAPPDDLPDPAQRPPTGDAQRPITFGAMGSLLKTNRRVVEVYARILLAVPGSRLLLKSHGLSQPQIREQLSARFARHGIDPARLDLLPPTPGLREHLSTYNRIDIALDSFPYTGTTTTCEALLMGVPVVSLAGPPPPRGGHAGRVGLSLLSAAGVPELVTHSEDEFAALAAALAGDPGRLERYRATLRATMLGSALCDAPAFTRRFEAALRSAWRARC